MTIRFGDYLIIMNNDTIFLTLHIATNNGICSSKNSLRACSNIYWRCGHSRAQWRWKKKWWSSSRDSGSYRWQHPRMRGCCGWWPSPWKMMRRCGMVMARIEISVGPCGIQSISSSSRKLRCCSFSRPISQYSVYAADGWRCRITTNSYKIILSSLIIILIIRLLWNEQKIS